MVASKSSQNIQSESILNGLDSSVIVIDDRSHIAFLNSSIASFVLPNSFKVVAKLL